MKEKFCSYCRLFKPDEGFKTINHPSGTRRYMCGNCQDRRKLPRERLVALAEQDKQARKAR